ncbi:hypothetical protein [Sulfitobacter sp.]|uniref:hypothetical protein n=1 Tax=Sulfitobacter sp. TaxID=1903071 RepID=UPI0030011EFA
MEQLKQDPDLEIISFERRVWDALVSGDTMADGYLPARWFYRRLLRWVCGQSGHTGQLAAGPTVSSYTLD